MKNLLKPLQWKHDEQNDSCEATVQNDFGYHYYIAKDQDGYHATLVDNNNNGLWVGSTYETMDAAKVASQKHFENIVLFLLSPEAVETLLKSDF